MACIFIEACICLLLRQIWMIQLCILMLQVISILPKLQKERKHQHVTDGVKEKINRLV